ncbi:MAG: hypothetical protein JOY81_06000 [Alphaproteobacteria bacterium]|nr:hypothetical protein [Alphaproteobacteria bacterium]
MPRGQLSVEDFPELRVLNPDDAACVLAEAQYWQQADGTTGLYREVNEGHGVRKVLLYWIASLAALGAFIALIIQFPLPPSYLPYIKLGGTVVVVILGYLLRPRRKRKLQPYITAALKNRATKSSGHNTEPAPT